MGGIGLAIAKLPVLIKSPARDFVVVVNRAQVLVTGEQGVDVVQSGDRGEFSDFTLCIDLDAELSGIVRSDALYLARGAQRTCVTKAHR